MRLSQKSSFQIFKQLFFNDFQYPYLEKSYAILPMEQTLSILDWNLKQIQQASKFFVFLSKKSHVIGYFFTTYKQKDRMDSPNSQKSLTFQTKKANRWISFLWTILTFRSFIFFLQIR